MTEQHNVEPVGADAGIPASADTSATSRAASVLPSYRTDTRSDLWLTPADFDRVNGKLHFRSDLTVSVSAIIICLLIVFPYFEPSPISHLIRGLLSIWVSAGLLVPIFGVAKGIDYVESSKPREALRVCDRLIRMGFWLSPVGMLWSRIVTAQVQAVACSELGRIVEAQTVIGRWFWDRRHHRFTEPAIETTVAHFYVRAGNLPAAHKLYAGRYQAMKNRPFGSRFSRAVTTSNMGWITLVQGDYAESKRHSEEALDKIKGMLPGSLVKGLKVNTLINLARAELRLEEYEIAEQHLEQAWELVCKMHKHVQQNKAEIQLAYAELRMMESRWDEALLYAQSSTECYLLVAAPGIESRDYAMRLHAQILRHLNREADALKLETRAEFEAADLIESNEHEMQSLRIKLLPG